MELIKTPSFELAIYKRGNENAERFMLCLPGRLDTKDYPNMRGHVDYFSKKGYLAVSFDPPGTWESPGDIELYTMTNYLKAIDELIVYFGNKPTVLIGHSRGGTIAMIAGIKNKSVTHFIAVMSSTSPSQIGWGELNADVEITLRDMPPNDSEHKKTFYLPLNYFKDAEQYNPLEALRTCTKPKLFIRGTKDTVIDLEEIKEAYENSADPKVYREINSEHDYRLDMTVVEEVNKIVDEFLSSF